LSALGSTDINRALLEAASMTSPERPTYLIFLTDGLPTEGVIDSQMILDNLANIATENLRLFAFGVGYDVDTFLLDSLAEDHHGASMYVLPGEPLGEIVSTFYAKISTPVLTNLNLDFGDVSVYDVYPAPLPDLFVGSQIVALGRYYRGGTTDVTLTGIVNDETQTFRYPEQIFSEESLSNDPLSSIPRLWATRKIGYLLNHVRLKGPDEETINQIVKLSIRYGIVTPYTSYLVTEPMPLGSDNQDRIVEEEFAEMESAIEVPAHGRDAVEKAVEQGAMQAADTITSPSEEVSGVVRIIGSRTFVLSDDIWIDTVFDPDRMETRQVAFLSDDYFDLVENHPELGAAFALGDRVIAFANGVAYEVVSPDAQVDPLDIPNRPITNSDESMPSDIPDHGDTLYPMPTSTPTPSKPSSIQCMGGVLPLLLLPFGLILLIRRHVLAR
jgi:Ca-activated chloride channel family protein